MYKSINQSFKVLFKYKVIFTYDLFDLKNPTLKNIVSSNLGNDEEIPKKIIVIIDKPLISYHTEIIKNIILYCDSNKNIISLQCLPVLIAGGEQIKNNFDVISFTHEIINKYKICRHSYIIAIGGGAFLDSIGYAASTAHRGIRLIRVPTTVLSQNDSGIGVKTSINCFMKKNFIGSFTPPFMVINDSHFLKSLSFDNWKSGIVEAIKVSLIKDSDFFNFIEQNYVSLIKRNINAMKITIHRCAKLHANHISKFGDPFEFGSSRPLDFGHWSAHKLENLTNYSLSHGAAVAIGIALDCTYSYLIGCLTKEKWKRTIGIFIKLGFDLYVNELSIHYSDVMSYNCISNSNSIFFGLKEFKEHLGGKLTIMLINDIGSGININTVKISVFKRAIYILSKINNNNNLYL